MAEQNNNKPKGQNNSGDTQMDDGTMDQVEISSDGLPNFEKEQEEAERKKAQSQQQNLAQEPIQNEKNDIDRILGIPLTIHVELGRKRLQISELLEVGVGSIVELDSVSNSPLNIYANQTLIAQGEAVVVGERYGIRVTEIVSPAERVKRLGGKEMMS